MSSDERYLVVNIGCIECGVSSQIVGLFSSESRAKDVAEILSRNHHWREGGQNEYLVFGMPPLDEVQPEYRSAITGGDGDSDG